jgi:hypothetical protein
VLEERSQSVEVSGIDELGIAVHERADRLKILGLGHVADRTCTSIGTFLDPRVKICPWI